MGSVILLKSATGVRYANSGRCVKNVKVALKENSSLLSEGIRQGEETEMMVILRDVAKIFVGNDWALAMVARYAQKLVENVKIFVNKLWLAY